VTIAASTMTMAASGMRRGLSFVIIERSLTD
jgi:hypothetical protein